VSGRRVASLILAAVFLAACSPGPASSSSTPGASAPTPSPTATFEAVTVGPVTVYICRTCEEAAARLGLNLHADVVDVVRHVDGLPSLPTAYVDIADRPEGAIKEIGVGGYSLGTRVLISIDPSTPNLPDTVMLWLPRTLPHELDETKRRDALAEGETLRDHLVTHGLADTFSVEAFPQGPLESLGPRTVPGPGTPGLERGQAPS
jgi:hypothetical protein